MSDKKIIEFSWEYNQHDINKKLSKGWKLHGVPVNSGYTQDNGCQAEYTPCQAMVLEEQNELVKGE